MTDLPRPVSTDQHFYANHGELLARVADLLAEQNELLRQVLTDRQAGQPEEVDPADDGPVAVELREPEPAPADDPKTTRATRTPGRRPKASK